MSRFKVVFDVNGELMTVKCNLVKPGNRYLQCRGETKNNDQALLAMIPFDSVEYIVHQSISVTTDDVTPAADTSVDTFLG